MFKVGHYYEGINPDNTLIIYKVLRTNDGFCQIEVVRDKDKSTPRCYEKGDKITIMILPFEVDKDNRWLYDAKEITNIDKIVAFEL